MAVVSEVQKIQGKLLLNNGRDSEGNIKTVTISMPTLSDTATAAQMVALADVISPLLTKSIYSLQRVTYESLSDE